jgi:carbonic anhydrase
VKNQVDKIKSTPFLPKDIPVYGFVYDVRTGKIKEAARATATAATVPEVKEEQKISKRTR